jgi:hypothetical protein
MSSGHNEVWDSTQRILDDTREAIERTDELLDRPTVQEALRLHREGGVVNLSDLPKEVIDG